MKKIIAPGIALLMAVVLSVNAFAMEVPTETTVQNLNGVQQYIKVYTLLPDEDPNTLLEEPFEYEGYTYTYSSIVKQENYFTDRQEHMEVITVETEKKDLSAVLAALEPSIEFDDGKYKGTLNLDHTTIKTEAAGYTTKSYTVTAVKEIGNLDSNDMAYVPSTTVKDGKTIKLTSVDWQVQGTALVDDILVPSQYKAVATYSGRASYNAATGYISTAKYVGDVSCNEVESITYTVVYVGKETQPEILNGGDTTMESELGKSTFRLGEHWPFLLAGLGAVVLAVLGGLMICRRRRRQAEAASDVDEYELEEDSHEV